MRFVLDNSVTMRWLFKDGKPEDLTYAMRVLASFDTASALVPHLWHLEVANVLASAESDGRMTESESQSFITQLDQLPVTVDGTTFKRALGETLNVARRYKLSSYDAAYLELAMREKLPLATLDGPVRKAAKKLGIGMYLDADV